MSSYRISLISLCTQSNVSFVIHKNFWNSNNVVGDLEEVRDYAVCASWKMPPFFLLVSA